MTRIMVLSDLWQPFPGGAERLMFNLARDLMRRGEDVQVLTGYEAAQQFDGPPLHIEPLGVFDNRASGAAFVTGYVKSLRPDVILTHHLYAKEFAPELEASGVPVVQVVLNGERLPFAALAVYISRWVRNRAVAHAGDLTITPPVFADVVADSHGQAIGFIKPIKHKGIELVYRLAARMPARRFVILRGEWQTLEDIRELPNVTFMEPVLDMRDFYREVRLLLMPSESEDAGTVAQEATLNGLPCISSNVQGLNETNRGGIRLHPHALQRWLYAIRDLDSPAYYERVVRRQQRHLASTDQDGRLDELARRIKAL